MSAPSSRPSPSVQTGLERLLTDPQAQRLVRGRRVGLVAHPASVTSSLMHAREVLLQAGAELRVLFGPEHGYGGEAQDMIGVAGAHDPETGAPIYSLYGSDEASLSPRPAWLEGLDAVVIDLQDVGSRYYTFVWTAVLMARACSAAGVETLVLDRPNPLGGLAIEGAPQQPGLCSFVGLRPVPVRHGLTLGELVLDAAREEGLQGVSVLEMQGWRREMLFADTGLPWVLPSPNMPTPETALVYPGGCLLEGTNASEGRGTTRPFEIFGAPWVSGPALAAAIDEACEGAARARALTFQPTFHKHGGKLCGGVQVHVFEPRRFAPYRAYLAALRALRRQEGFGWRTERYEFVDTHPAIDLLTGDARVRLAIDAGASVDELLAVGAERWDAWREPQARWRYPAE
jgi:uncharacterized protein YbbC (DUF1343 family)